MFTGEDTKDEIQIRGEDDEEDGVRAAEGRGVESSSSAAAHSAKPESIRTSPEDERPAYLYSILWLLPLQQPPVNQKYSELH